MAQNDLRGVVILLYITMIDVHANWEVLPGNALLLYARTSGIVSEEIYCRRKKALVLIRHKDFIIV